MGGPGTATASESVGWHSTSRRLPANDSRSLIPPVIQQDDETSWDRTADHMLDNYRCDECYSVLPEERTTLGLCGQCLDGSAKIFTCNKCGEATCFDEMAKYRGLPNGLRGECLRCRATGRRLATPRTTGPTVCRICGAMGEDALFIRSRGLVQNKCRSCKAIENRVTNAKRPSRKVATLAERSEAVHITSV